MEKNDINLKEIIEQETGQRFNRDNKICCPFHSEKTPSFSVMHSGGKWRWRCFGGCDKGGDVIDFIEQYKGLNYIDARKYLGLEVNERIQTNESNKDLIKNSCKKVYGHECKDIFPFVDIEGNVIYYMIRFYKDGKKEPRCCRVVDGKVIWNLEGIKKVPYNLYKTNRAIRNNIPIFILEGEKDANTIATLGYTGTSFKGVTDFDFSIFQDARVYVVGDTGEAGDKYKAKVKKDIFKYAKEFHFVNLKGIEELGDNKDVTDWLEYGHSHDEFKRCLKKSLDLKNKYELQQDANGIYKTIFKGKPEDLQEIKVYITNFNILSAKKITFVDEDKEGIELVCRSKEGLIETRTGETNVFNDVRTFKTFLGRMALNFKGKIDDLSNLQDWIDTYIIQENHEIYTGIKFINNMLITQDGAITANGFNKSISATVEVPTELNCTDLISKEEIEELLHHLFRYNTVDNCTCILGTIVHNMAYELAKKNGIKLHHLMVIGESGSGKSTVKRNVVAALLGYPEGYEGKAIDNITKFSLLKSVSSGNYTNLFDEYKPSMMNPNSLNVISSILRNLYDGMSTERGHKDQSTTIYKLTTPVIIFGEENTQQTEKAVIERSLICYLSKFNRPLDSLKSIEYLSEHRDLLIKFSNTILLRILTMDNKEYQTLRQLYKDSTTLKDRMANTFINTCVGMHIINDVLVALDSKEINKNYMKIIEDTIKANVMEDGEDIKADYEEMLLKLNELMEIDQDIRTDKTLFYINATTNKTYLRINHMLDKLSKHIKDYGLNFRMLSKNDFIKRCEMAQYITNKSKQIKVDGTPIRFAEFDSERLYDLGCYEMIAKGYATKRFDEKEKEKFEIVK